MKWFVIFIFLVVTEPQSNAEVQQATNRSAIGTSSKGEDMSKRSQLVGTWKLKVLEDFVEGKWVRTFGENPVGYFSFGADGNVSVQFQKEGATKPFAADQPTPDEALIAYEGYLAYFGRYSVSEEAETFTSIVEAALNPVLIGTRQTRQFKIVGSQLIVGDQVTYRRYFEKL